MKLLKTIYLDSYGNEWVIQSHSLPKKKGDYKFWTGECMNRSYRAESKTRLFKKIETNEQSKIQL